MSRKGLSAWSKDINLGIRKVQRYRKIAGVGTLTPAGYMLNNLNKKS